MDLAHLLGFIRMGDYVASLLKDALDASGLNLTKAMVCWHLVEHDKPGGLNLTELSRLAGASPARVQAQLKQLLSDELIQTVQQPAIADRRVTRYVLSRKGRRQTQIFVDRAGCARGALWAEVFSGPKEQSDLSTWSRISYRLATSLNGADDKAGRRRYR